MSDLPPNDIYIDEYLDTYDVPGGGASDHDVEAITFDGGGAIELDPEVEALGGSEFAGGATGALTADATVIPTGDDVLSDAAVLGASASLSVAEPTIEGPGGSDIDVEPVTFRASGGVYGQPSRIRRRRGRWLLSAPTAAVRAALEAPQIEVWRAVDILNADETMWATDVGFTAGSVSVDLGRDERRTLQLTLDNIDRRFSPSESGFWYDKIVRPRRGVVVDGTQYEFDLGYFMIDQIDRGDDMNLTIGITGRDYTKKMITSRIEAALSFKATDLLCDVIKALAYNSGITRTSVPWSTQTLGKVYTFDADASRWSMAKQLATDFNQELYVSADGTLTMTPQRDPVTSPTVLSIGEAHANSVDLGRSTNDGELYNHVVVVSTVGDTTLPVWASVENNEPSSPTRISRIGRRTKRIESALATTAAQCLEIARTFIAVSALEQFDVSFKSLNYPWLDVGGIIDVDDPEASPGDPSRYLLSSLEIPMNVGPMGGNCKRVTIVGKDYELHEASSPATELVWGDEAA